VARFLGFPLVVLPEVGAGKTSERLVGGTRVLVEFFIFPVNTQISFLLHPKALFFLVRALFTREFPCRFSRHCQTPHCPVFFPPGTSFGQLNPLSRKNLQVGPQVFFNPFFFCLRWDSKCIVYWLTGHNLLQFFSRFHFAGLLGAGGG